MAILLGGSGQEPLHRHAQNNREAPKHLKHLKYSWQLSVGHTDGSGCNCFFLQALGRVYALSRPLTLHRESMSSPSYKCQFACSHASRRYRVACLFSGLACYVLSITAIETTLRWNKVLNIDSLGLRRPILATDDWTCYFRLYDISIAQARSSKWPRLGRYYCKVLRPDTRSDNGNSYGGTSLVMTERTFSWTAFRTPLSEMPLPMPLDEPTLAFSPVTAYYLRLVTLEEMVKRMRVHRDTHI